MRRQFVGIVGLLLGFGLYQFALRFPEPWSNVVIGVYFAALGIGALVYARGDRVVQVVGGLLLLFGVVRAFL